ncbi:hypothetical protein [Roseovarius aquimarinus]|uniref:Intracellular septation protein A n=1 Tax=Roseovarius aquimarinus TaxID=1229156 RepID=A0ABW7I853_9RHOB
MNDFSQDKYLSHLNRLMAISGGIWTLLAISAIDASGSGGYWLALIVAFALLVMCAWLYGWKLPLYAGPGAALHLMGYLGSGAGTCNLTLATVAAIIAAPFAFTTMRWAGINLEVDPASSIRIWRVILLAGVKTSIFAFIMAGAVVRYASALTFSYEYSLSFVLGSQLFGLFAFMTALTFAFWATQQR